MNAGATGGAIPVEGIALLRHRMRKARAKLQIEEEWIDQKRYELQRRYGAGTFVAIYDWAVVDWGTDPEVVRGRAEALLRDRVFVGVVPAEPKPDLTNLSREESDAWYKRFTDYKKRYEATGDKRRFRLGSVEGSDGFSAVAELDICGKTEFVDGVIIIDGVERRYADHDYRLMVEHGIVPKETELIAGVIFWKDQKSKPEDAS